MRKDGTNRTTFEDLCVCVCILIFNIVAKEIKDFNIEMFCFQRTKIIAY